MQKQQIEVELNEDTLKRYMMNIYKHLYKQHLAQQKILNSQQRVMREQTINTQFILLSDSCSVNSELLAQRALEKQINDNKFIDSKGLNTEFEMTSFNLCKKLNLFAKYFEVLDEKFQFLSQKMDDLDTKLSEYLPYQSYYQDQKNNKDDILKEIKQILFVTQLSNDQKLEQLSHSISFLKTNIDNFQKDNQWKINDFQSQLETKLNLQMLETTEKIIQQNVIQEITKLCNQSVSALEKELRESQQANKMKLDVFQINLNNCHQTMKEVNQFLQAKTVSYEQFSNLKILSEEKNKDVVSKLQEIFKKLTMLSQIDSLQKQVNNINNVNIEFKTQQLQLQNDIERQQEQMGIVQRQLIILDQNPIKIQQLEIQVQTLTQQTVETTEALENQLKETQRKLGNFEKAFSNQIIIINDEIKKKLFSREEIIEFVEKELNYYQSNLKTRVLKVIHHAFLTPDGQPFNNVQIQKIIKNQNEIMQKIDNLEIKNNQGNLNDKKLEPIKLNFNQLENNNTLYKEIDVINKQITKLQTQVNQLENQNAELQDLQKTIQSLDQVDKSQIMNALVGNVKNLKHKCTTCGEQFNNYKIKIFQKEETSPRMKETEICEISNTAVIERFKTSSQDYNKTSYIRRRTLSKNQQY